MMVAADDAMMVAADDAMVAVEKEEVTVVIGAAEATRDMAATEGVVATATAADTATATTSRHTIFKPAGSLYFLMSFGVDTLGGLSEKLKQLIDDTQNLYESFIDANQLYRQGKMGDREFFAQIGDYLIATSALNFLAVRVILEIKTALEKGTSIKSPTGGSSSPSAPQADFGIGGFVGTGGTVGPAAASGNEYTLHSPQEPTFKPVDIELPKPRASAATTKNCIVCNASIPAHAKFCSKCGRSQ
jgi:hypothetical protein